MPGSFMNYNPEVKRRVGRPKVRWINVAKNGMKKASHRNWRIAAKDRDGWRSILEEANAHLGL
jgi:hypothetical protein